MYRHALRHGDMVTVSSTTRTTRISHAFSAFQSSDNEAPPKWFHEDRSGQVFGCLWVFALWHIVTYCDGTAVKFIQEIWTNSRYFMLFHLIFESAKWSKCWSILSSFVDVKKCHVGGKKTGAAALEQQIFLPRDHGLRGHPIRSGRPKFPSPRRVLETRSPISSLRLRFFFLYFFM